MHTDVTRREVPAIFTSDARIRLSVAGSSVHKPPTINNVSIDLCSAATASSDVSAPTSIPPVSRLPEQCVGGLEYFHRTCKIERLVIVVSNDDDGQSMKISARTTGTRGG